MLGGDACGGACGDACDTVALVWVGGRFRASVFGILIAYLALFWVFCWSFGPQLGTKLGSLLSYFVSVSYFNNNNKKL